jgi:hypothetical protein
MPDRYGETESENRVRLTCASDLEPREVEWLWVGRVPLGMITMFAGDPKLGKSFVTLAMAAAVSRGLPLPMSNGIDDHRNAALRGVLTPLKTLAERLGAAVVLVSHATKGGSGNRKHRVLGSIAYVGACRANHFFLSATHGSKRFWPEKPSRRPKS